MGLGGRSLGDSGGVRLPDRTAGLLLSSSSLASGHEVSGFALLQSHHDIILP